MSALVVIPARYGSTRLPGKMLLKETGKYLVQHVWEVAKAAQRADRVIIATEDPRVRDACHEFGAEVMLTGPQHPSGTSRCAEVARAVPCDRVVNLQGDEPEMDPAVIDRVIDALDEAEYATAATALRDEDRSNPNRVKVVVDAKGFALHFSRAGMAGALLHLGIYGFRRDFLLKFVELPETGLEKAERLEQLRALYHGYRCKVVTVEFASMGGIDTIADYRAFAARYRRKMGLQRPPSE